MEITIDEDNEYIVDNDVLTFSIGTDIADVPLYGSVIITNETTGEFIFTPGINFNGFDRFLYVASDGSLQDFGWVYFTINPVNDAPVVTDISISN